MRYYIFFLKRLSVGEITLGESLKPGEFRPFTEEERKLEEKYRKLYIENIKKSAVGRFFCMQEKNH